MASTRVLLIALGAVIIATLAVNSAGAEAAERNEVDEMTQNKADLLDAFLSRAIRGDNNKEDKPRRKKVGKKGKKKAAKKGKKKAGKNGKKKAGKNGKVKKSRNSRAKQKRGKANKRGKQKGKQRNGKRAGKTNKNKNKMSKKDRKQARKQRKQARKQRKQARKDKDKKMTKKERKQARKDKKANKKKIKSQKEARQSCPNEAALTQGVKDLAAAGNLASKICATVSNLIKRIPKFLKLIDNKGAKKGDFITAAEQLQTSIQNKTAPKCASTNFSTATLTSDLDLLLNCESSVQTVCAPPPDATAINDRITACTPLKDIVCTRVDTMLNNPNGLATFTEAGDILATKEFNDLKTCRDDLVIIDKSVKAAKTTCLGGFVACRKKQISSIAPIGQCKPSSSSSSSATTTSSTSSSTSLSSSTKLALAAYQATKANSLSSSLSTAISAVTRQLHSQRNRVVRADGANCLSVYNKVVAAQSGLASSISANSANQTLADTALKAVIEAEDIVKVNGTSYLKTCSGATSSRKLTELKTLQSSISSQVTSLASQVTSFASSSGISSTTSLVSGVSSATTSSGRRKRRLAIENVLSEFRFKDDFA